MNLPDALANGSVALYGLNRRTLQLRGAYRFLKVASKVLPKLRAYPIRFPETGEVYADVNEPDTFPLLNAFVGDMHPSLRYLAELAEAALAPGDVAWDVGGSMGLFSSQIAQSRFRLSSVHLFEPHLSPFKVAKDLLGKNPIVHLHPFGLGKTSGTADLYFGFGSGSASMKYRPDGTSCFVTCRIETGDALVEKGLAEPPALIKIDVEGIEPEVLKGLQKTISSKKPVVLFEILFLSNAELLDSIPEDYRICFIRDKDGRLINDLETARRIGVMDAMMAPRASDLWLKLKSRFVA